MESNYEAGERIFLSRPYVFTGHFGAFIPSGEAVLLIDGPHKHKKYNSTSFSWNVMTPCGKMIKISEDYF